MPAIGPVPQDREHSDQAVHSDSTQSLAHGMWQLSFSACLACWHSCGETFICKRTDCVDSKDGNITNELLLVSRIYPKCVDTLIRGLSISLAAGHVCVHEITQGCVFNFPLVTQGVCTWLGFNGVFTWSSSKLVNLCNVAWSALES